MKKLILIFLSVSAVIDISQDAYQTGLVGNISNPARHESFWSVLAASSVVTTIEHWLLCFVGFGVLSLAMSFRKRAGPDIIR